MKSSTSTKRVYRDVNGGVIAGVCAGVARYLEVDPLWVRIAAVAGAIVMPMVTLIAYLAAVFLLPRW